MTLGLSLSAFTLLHVIISLVGIGSGFVVLLGLLAGKRLDGWTALFLATTIATSLTGYLFPVHKLLPSHIVGAISLAVLSVAVAARYGRCLAGRWRLAYVIAATVALYLNVFVLVVQSFAKVPALKALAPTQSEAPFVITQLTVLLLFAGLGILAAKKFRDEAPALSTARAAD